MKRKEQRIKVPGVPILTKKKLAELVADRCRLTPAYIEGIIEYIIDEITKWLLMGGSVSFYRFLKIFPAERPSYIAFNPKAGVKVESPAKKALRAEISEKVQRQFRTNFRPGVGVIEEKHER